MISARQEQIIIGTVLGGSSLLKPPKGLNYYLAMRSCNELWLRYKIEELEGIFTSGLYRSGNTYRCYSLCLPQITAIQGIMFKNKKRVISMKLLDHLRLRDTSLAIWYLEAGGKTGRGRKNAYLSTTIYGEEGSLAISEYFNAIDCDNTVNKNKNRRRIVFSVPGTERFFKVVANLFPTFMYCKL